MKLQLQGQQVRLRLSEADLAQLLANGRCTDSTWLSANSWWRRTLRLVDAQASFTHEGNAWEFALPRQAFEAFASERPRRDGYRAALAGGSGHAIELSVEVDVRDSRKHTLPNAGTGQQ
jgi:hypothetical protein